MNNEEKKDQLETMLEEFIAKYPDCKIDWEHKSKEDIDFKMKNGIDIDIRLYVPDRKDRIISERLDFFCNWALEGVELVEDQMGYFSSEEDDIFTENQKLHFNKALNEKGSICKELNVNENQASFFDDGQIDFGADPEVTKKLTKYFNNKGKKLRKQKFKVAKEDSVFFIK
ncbi:Unknown protein sequence [Pseudomonas amygdali pv. eriobotryae]|uniref:Uncharacterized protein n=1 Tax=Pseudomonas amygdali pv. eriobotryae TaxID=129137 RepID=A0A0P9PZC7_PSEA0|nr:hypothetical protein [Pseudomonas amygdali]KPX26139.1 Unknown protein sequence [Pseudomonas amygdali pv. eriobotryae]KWS79759.1 hypothetical protein AL052_25600 [Pseudomonas amygdali pv. eriobotryae]